MEAIGSTFKSNLAKPALNYTLHVLHNCQLSTSSSSLKGRSYVVLRRPRSPWRARLLQIHVRQPPAWRPHKHHVTDLGLLAAAADAAMAAVAAYAAPRQRKHLPPVGRRQRQGHMRPAFFAASLQPPAPAPQPPPPPPQPHPSAQQRKADDEAERKTLTELCPSASSRLPTLHSRNPAPRLSVVAGGAAATREGAGSTRALP